MLITKKVGKVEYNDGQFAEVQTYGIEGIEEGLLLETLQIHREDTNYTSEEFQKRLPPGIMVEIVTTIEFTIKRDPCDLNGPNLRSVAPTTESVNESIFRC